MESAIGEEMDNPMENVYGGMILRRESFIKEILSRLEGGLAERGSLSQEDNGSSIRNRGYS